MLDHTDRQLARLVDFLEVSGRLDNTLVLVLSDNGASQEGGPKGFVNAMGPYNLVHESTDAKLARLDDIGGPDTHSNFPWGWAMVANTPLKRYKQNTHGGGVRDPLVDLVARGHRRRRRAPPPVRPRQRRRADAARPARRGSPRRGERRGPAADRGDELPPDIRRRRAPRPGKTVQYFEMFSHRGIWIDGWKAVAYHAPGHAARRRRLGALRPRATTSTRCTISPPPSPTAWPR